MWNLWLPKDTAEIAGVRGPGLTNLQYATICEIQGTAHPIEFAAEVCNCTSPDTGNMETIARYGNPDQRAQWLQPLLDGDIRSCFAMTEPAVASSDASNISIRIDKDEAADEYVINGSKWWITGAGNVRCKVMILMGKTSPNETSPYKQQSMLLMPMNTKGIELVRPMMVFGDNDCPKGHFEIRFNNVRVPTNCLLLGEGRGFEISQGRLGPGRIHHCMRLIGTAERALAAMCQRANSRVAFGKKLRKFDTIVQQIAQSRAEIDMARFLVQSAADDLDKVGNKNARKKLALVKAVVPKMTQTVCDRAIQVHGGAGVSQDTPLIGGWAAARSLRLADGPDEVHYQTAALMELRDQSVSWMAGQGYYEWDKSVPWKVFTGEEGDSLSVQSKL